MKLKLESYKKKSVWVAVASFIALTAKTFNVIHLPPDFEVWYTAFFSLLTTLGILIDA